MRIHRAVAALALAAGLCGATGASAEPSIYPTGVTRYDPAKACNMFVLFSGADDKTYLIDMDGNVVHRWDHPGFPAGMLDPALAGGARGHVVLQLATIPVGGTGAIPGMPSVFSDKVLGEVDWDGKVVWQWGDQAPGGAARQHHDWSRLPNGDTLVLSNLNRPLPGFKLKDLLDDVIYEVTPKGDIVWKWLAGDHLAEFGFTAKELALVRKSPAADYLHFNDMKVIGPNHWFRDGDKRFNPDNIMVSSRDANFTLIIDKATGHVVWRIGPHYAPSPPPGTPLKLPAAIDQISGQHDPHLIPDGLQGAGDLLMFDNQGEAGFPAAELKVFPGSRVLEIDPVKKQIVWMYTGANTAQQEPWTFYSSFISDARRLPNGNTFIDEGMNGRFIQITPKGEIVWEYVSPYVGPQPRLVTNQVYRAQPVPYDWAPDGTPHAETAVAAPDLATFHVPQGK